MSWILYINSDRMKESLGFSDFYSIVAYENREKHANSTDFNTTWKWKIVIYFGFYQAKSFIVSISDCFATSYYLNKSELIVWNNNKQNMDQLIWFVYEWRGCFFCSIFASILSKFTFSFIYRITTSPVFFEI